MKFKTKQLTDNNELISHLILSCLNDTARLKIQSIENRDSETEYDISLRFEGIELDITEFIKLVEKQIDRMIDEKAAEKTNELFEKWKHSYKSKNSKAAKLEKIKEQFDKVNNQLSNINSQLENI